MQRSPSPQHSPDASEENVPVPPPPTAAVPALRFGSSDDRLAVSAPSPLTDGGTIHTSEGSPSGLAENPPRWERPGSHCEKSRTFLDEDGTEEDHSGNLPALRRPSSLFDSALGTDALLARLQQRQSTEEARLAAPSASSSSSPPVADGEPPARRPAIPITSVLGRPPTAPPVASAPVASPTEEAYPFTAAQREQSGSSFFRAHLRSASPASTVDYVEIEHKQNELRHAVEHHIQSLERSLALRDEEVATLTSRLRKLEEDYQFNYNLIAERDAALEEASAQLQRLYRELKRLTEEATRTGKKVDVAEVELRAARQRVREVEEERDGAVRQVQKDYAIKERHLFDNIREREAALEQEQKEQHDWYKAQVKLLEEERATFADRSASISMEAEERCKQQVGRLQSELGGVQRELKAARQSRADDERRIAVLGEEKAALLHEAARAQERHDAALQEATLAKQELTERLARVTAEAERRATAAEAATREEGGRASRLEMERTRLQAMLSEAQERIQHLTIQFDDDIARYTKERQALLQRNDAATAATAAVEQALQDTQRELEKQRRLAAEEAERLGRELDHARAIGEETRQALVVAQESGAKWEAAAERFEAEVRRWKSEEDKTATSGRQERSAWEERCRQAERRTQQLEEEAERVAKLHHVAVEKAQGEAARLTRELHASEAARRTLEDQFHLLEDCREDRNVLQTLRMEKEQLLRRVGELEHTNEEVRQQVAAFTAELQNDPILKAAKDSQQRMVELQQELAEAKAELQLLRDTVKEKDDELVRYQTEMLRVQVLMGGDNDASAAVDVHSAGKSLYFTTPFDGLSEQVSRVLQRQQQQMRCEYSKMRESYEEMVRELDRQRHHRRRKANAATSRGSSASSASSSSGPSSPSHASSRADAHGNAEEQQPHRHHRRHHKSSSGAKAGASLPPVLPDSKAAHLVQEMEVWRQRCVQLEQQLHTVLRERDRLRKELQLAKQDVVALGTEKQSLVDLNSLLKAQLREAYRMRTAETAIRNPTAEPPSAAASLDQKGVRISPELLAAALQALEEDRRGGARAAGQHLEHTRAPAHIPVGGTSAAHATPPVVHSTRGFDASERPQTSSSSSAAAAAAGGRSSAQAAQERLAALEREIDDVRGQLGATAAQTQTRHPVVRRGAAAVRHYGYGG